MTEWKEQHYESAEESDRMFKTNTQGAEVDISRGYDYDKVNLDGNWALTWDNLKYIQYCDLGYVITDDVIDKIVGLSNENRQLRATINEMRVYAIGKCPKCQFERENE